jgi:hypothetical protein
MSATRPWVDAFADAMERKLALNRHKGDREGWQKLAGSQLTIMLRHEVAELCEAVEMARPLDSGKPEGVAARLAVVNECADVANIAMMIADVVGEMLPSPEGGAGHRDATLDRCAVLCDQIAERGEARHLHDAYLKGVRACAAAIRAIPADGDRP